MEIPLSRGYFAVIDENDFDLIKGMKWHAINCRGRVYAISSRRKDSPSILMHRLILGASNGKLVDHIDCDGLNNRRANLRECTAFENMQHRKLHKNSKSGFKNVWQEVVNGQMKWRAVVIHNKKRYRKTFETPEDAYLWAVETRKKLHGEFFYDPCLDVRATIS